MARIGQMQPGTSFFRFVPEHLMRHSETCREDFPIKSGFLSDAPARCFHRTFGASTHILWFEFFGGDQLATLYQHRRLLMDKVFSAITDALMESADLLG